MAFNAELTARVVEDCKTASPVLGSIVGNMLNANPDLRPSAQEVCMCFFFFWGGVIIAVYAEVSKSGGRLYTHTHTHTHTRTHTHTHTHAHTHTHRIQNGLGGK